MCGIIGYVGHQQAAPILLDGLARMEYRGYDSAGVAVRSETKGLQVYKSKGRLQVLSDMIHGGADVEGTLGIGHTRWATHGEPNDINAHPHVSEDGRIAMVHNGIIENYMEIKQQLLRHGVTFKSETDTEVAAQLLEFHYNECHNMLEAVGRVLRRIEGSYAFGIICADYPNALIAARKDSLPVIQQAPAQLQKVGQREVRPVHLHRFFLLSPMHAAHGFWSTTASIRIVVTCFSGLTALRNVHVRCVSSRGRRAASRVSFVRARRSKA